LAQMREFTNAYYGTGTAFELANTYLTNGEITSLQLAKAYIENLQDADEKKFHKSLLDQSDTQPFPLLLRGLFGLKKQEDVDKMVKIARQTEKDEFLWKIFNLYENRQAAADAISFLILDLKNSNIKILDVLQEMYTSYAPFRYCIENKETSLIIRRKDIVDDYTREATAEERALLDDTENEAQLTKKWILQINKQDRLESKTLTTDFEGAELTLLHKIQSKYLRKYRKETNKEQLQQLDVKIQMSILAVSEALGFAG